MSLFLLETSPSKTLKDNFWRLFDLAKTNPSVYAHSITYINPRFLHGEKICTINEPIDAKIPISCTLFVDHKSSAIVVCFPGTNDARQIAAFTTLRATQMPWVKNKSLQAQRGFLSIYSEIADAVILQLQNTIELFPDYSLVIAGYSLGGVLCRLLLWHLMSLDTKFEHTARNTQVMTWGAPRVFTTRPAAFYSEQFLNESTGIQDFRFEMPGDKIVTLPPRWIGYEHVGTRILMTLPELKEMNTRFERLFAGIHQSYIPNMRFTLQNMLTTSDNAIE